MTIPIKYNSAGNTHAGTAPVVIIGPNGAGKTRYGLQVAQWNDAEAIAALRNIALQENIPMQSLAQAEQELKNKKQLRRRKPWSIASEIDNLFAKLMAEDSASAMDFRDNYRHKAEPDITRLMRLQRSWEKLFPGRRISFKGYTPKVTSEYVTGESEYSAQSMSDGERVALYLAGRVLEAKSGVIVIDEPEVHFHSRLAMHFWDELETLRPDCRFVYITHDLQFSRSRSPSGYLIVKPGVDPQVVSVEEAIPPDIVEDILAAASFSIYAKRVIFCEGDESSYDQKLYRAYFSGRGDAVVPVGACQEVVKCTTAFSDAGFVEGMQAIGIVDRDYLPDSYLNSFPKDIHLLPAHEIESLFCLRSLFFAIAGHLGKSSGEANRLYDEFLTEARSLFAGELRLKQASERFRLRCTDQFYRALNGLSASGSEAEVRAAHVRALDPAVWSTPPGQLFDEELAVVDSAIGTSESELLRVLPGKVYFPKLVRKLGIDKSTYVGLIADSLLAEPGEDLYGLGDRLRTVLAEIIPDGQQDDAPDVEDAGDH